MTSPGYISGELIVEVGEVYVDPPGDDLRHAYLDLDQASSFRLIVTDDDDFNIDLLNGDPVDGDSITLAIQNDAGGAMGTVTWDADLIPYGASFPLPDDGESLTYAFTYDGADWRQTAGVPLEVFRAERLLTSADILSGNEFELVAAPGAGLFVNPISCTVVFTGGDTAYTNGDLGIGYPDLASAYFAPTLAGTNDVIFQVAPEESTPSFTEADNQPLVVASTTPATLGDGVAVVLVAYTVHRLPSL